MYLCPICETFPDPDVLAPASYLLVIDVKDRLDSLFHIRQKKEIPLHD